MGGIALGLRSTLGAVGMRSRVVVLAGTFTDATSSNELVVVGGPPSYATLGRGTLETRYGYDAAIGALRDEVIAVGIEDRQALLEVFDPFAMSVRGAAVSLGEAAEVGHGDAIDVAGSSKLGVAGVCWAVGSSDRGGGGSGIDFRVVGPDGRPIGAAVHVVAGAFRGGLVNCSVGTDEEGFLVGWWDGSALWVRRITLRD